MKEELGLPYRTNEHRTHLLRGLIIVAFGMLGLFSLYNLVYAGFDAIALVETGGTLLLLLLYRLSLSPLRLRLVRLALIAVVSLGVATLVLGSGGRDMNFVWLVDAMALAYLVAGRLSALVLTGVASAALVLYGLYAWPLPAFNDAAVLNLLGAMFALGLMLHFYATSRNESEAAVMALAHSDPLTGLWNRRYFIDACDREIERVRRHGIELSLLVVDIDYFKQINDEYGHQAGDGVLAMMAGAMTQRVRTSDVVGRLGGEEFGVLLPHTSLAQARIVAESLRRRIEAATVECAEGSFHCTISLGVAQFRQGMDFSDLYAAADAALYRAKLQGRNRICVAAPVAAA